MSTWTDERDAFFAHVQAWFTTLRAKVASILSAGQDAVTKAISDNSSKVEGDAVTFFEDAASQSVTTAAATAGTPEEKALTALTTFAGILAAKGITWGINESKIILESAYANFKASQPQVASVVDAVEQATGTN